MILGLVVEGHGEVAAMPLLVRRVAEWLGYEGEIAIPAPLRVHRSSVVKPGELERAIEFVARKVGEDGAILVILDADKDCAARLAPELAARAAAARPDRRIGIVLAVREYEAWLVAAADSLRGERTLPNDLAAPADPEALKSPKAWLDVRMDHGYAETVEQPKLTARFDLASARRADSFDKLVRVLAALLGSVAPNRTAPSEQA